MTDTKRITDDRHAEKVKEAKAALRGATSLMQKTLTQIDTMGNVMDSTARDLRHIAGEVGKIEIEVWKDGVTKSVSFKSHLQKLANALAEESGK